MVLTALCTNPAAVSEPSAGTHQWELLMPYDCGVCPSPMLQKRVREAQKAYETSTARWQVSSTWDWGCFVPGKIMTLNTSLGHSAEGNVWQNIFLLHQNPSPWKSR